MRVVHRFRPPDTHQWLELFRYADGRWIPDDGEPDVAFAGKAIPPGSTTGNWFPFAVGYALREGTDEAPFWVTTLEENEFWKGHPNSVFHNAGMQFCLDRYHGAANGLRVR